MLTPSKLAIPPKTLPMTNFSYDFDNQQSNYAIYANSQTFDSYGKPCDQTSGTGNRQTFDSYGQPCDQTS
jgi:hypothetical protein